MTGAPGGTGSAVEGDKAESGGGVVDARARGDGERTVALLHRASGGYRYGLRERGIYSSSGSHAGKWRLSPAHVVGTSLDETAGKHDIHVGENGITYLCVVAPAYLRSPRHDPLHILALY